MALSPLLVFSGSADEVKDVYWGAEPSLTIPAERIPRTIRRQLTDSRMSVFIVSRVFLMGNKGQVSTGYNEFLPNVSQRLAQISIVAACGAKPFACLCPRDVT